MISCRLGHGSCFVLYASGICFFWYSFLCTLPIYALGVGRVSFGPLPPCILPWLLFAILGSQCLVDQAVYAEPLGRPGGALVGSGSVV